jgi:uncharacterized phage-associated protein
MEVSRQREKLLNSIIYFTNNTQHCYMLKLMKLLYYLDFWHFKETGRSVTGHAYKTWKRGPVPTKVWGELKYQRDSEDIKEYLFIDDEEFDEVEGKKKTVIKPKKEFNEKIFTKRELNLLKKAADIFYEATADQMKDSTHLRNAPWYKTMKSKGDNQIIDYMLALDDEPDSLTEDIVKDKQALEKENQQLLDKL